MQKKNLGLITLKPLKNKINTKRFLGGVICCREMWKNSLQILAPSTESTVDAPFEWQTKHQESFNAIK